MGCDEQKGGVLSNAGARVAGANPINWGEGQNASAAYPQQDANLPPAAGYPAQQNQSTQQLTYFQTAQKAGAAGSNPQSNQTAYNAKLAAQAQADAVAAMHTTTGGQYGQFSAGAKPAVSYKPVGGASSNPIAQYSVPDTRAKAGAGYQYQSQTTQPQSQQPHQYSNQSSNAFPTGSFDAATTSVCVILSTN